MQFYAKAINANSLSVWDYSVEAASLLVEFGLQFTLRGSFVMDFGEGRNLGAKSCGMSHQGELVGAAVHAAGVLRDGLW